MTKRRRPRRSVEFSEATREQAARDYDSRVAAEFLRELGAWPSSRGVSVEELGHSVKVSVSGARVAAAIGGGRNSLHVGGVTFQRYVGGRIAAYAMVGYGPGAGVPRHEALRRAALMVGRALLVAEVHGT